MKIYGVEVQIQAFLSDKIHAPAAFTPKEK
jgi:hypothetical protein